jgi:hypothetical protein
METNALVRGSRFGLCMIDWEVTWVELGSAAGGLGK